MLSASILFDAAYIEPALVTAFELLAHRGALREVHLVYLASGGEDDAEAAALLTDFCERFNTERRYFSAITLADGLIDFRALHFNASILYKILLPGIVPQEDFLLNIDAGILPGERFGPFLDHLDRILCRGEPDWTIAAHCHEAATMLPEALAALPHNRLYPAGNLLLFNARRYRRDDWRGRIERAIAALSGHLVYAEQEVLCLTAREGELLELPGTEDRVTPFLGLDTLIGAKAPLPAAAARDCLFFKFVGSIKPWKYWVLDPDKAIFTRRRASLEAGFPIAGRALIEKHRTNALNGEWAEAFSKAYDSWLLSQAALL